MKKQRVGRKRLSGIPRRRLIRLNPEVVEVFDRYSDAELAEVVNRSLQQIFPKVPDAPKCPIVIRPVGTKTETICRIAIVGQEIKLIFPEKRDDFAILAKRFKFIFPNRCWSRVLPVSVDIVDRAAEIGNELLCAGFCIQVDCLQVQGRILGRSFQPEAFRIVKRCLKGEFAGCFLISWRKQEDFYAQSMKISASRYSENAVYVPSEHYLEVEDFAEIYDFELSEAAIELASEARLARASAVIVNPKHKTKKKAAKIEIIESDSIPAHLRDDGDD